MTSLRERCRQSETINPQAVSNRRVRDNAPYLGKTRGSVLIIVFVTMIFATAALFLFIEKASTDLIVVAQDSTADRLRLEAYSALETTVGVLVDFREASNGLHSPLEGWSDPLEFAGYEPAPDRTVEVTFEDESGKISLPTAQMDTLVNVFKAWDLPQADAEKLADALLGWMKNEHVATSAAAPRPEDYDRGELPFKPPGRALRSYSELAAIEYAREVFYDEFGRPNELWHRFVASFSLYQYRTPNVNAAAPDLLAAMGSQDVIEQRRMGEFLRGEGAYESTGAGYFKNKGEVANVLGARSPVAEKVGTDISALRIIVTVREGLNTYRLSALMAPPGGASIPKAQAQNAEGETANAQPPANTPAPSASAGGGGNTAAKNLNYPFTLLEIRENGAISNSPDPAPESPRA